jgi:hypothetical protein
MIRASNTKRSRRCITWVLKRNISLRHVHLHFDHRIKKFDRGLMELVRQYGPHCLARCSRLDISGCPRLDDLKIIVNYVNTHLKHFHYDGIWSEFEMSCVSGDRQSCTMVKSEEFINQLRSWFVDEEQGLMKFKALETIALIKCHDILDVSFLSGLIALKSVHLRKCYGLLSLGAVANASLREVVVEDCPRMGSLSEFLQGCSQVETFRLHACPGLLNSEIALLGGCAKLGSIGFSQLKQINGATMRKLGEKCVNIVELSLGDCPQIFTLQFLRYYQNLRVLKLTGPIVRADQAFDESDPPDLSHLRMWGYHLRYIYLRHFTFGPEFDAKKFLASSRCLQVLEIVDCHGWHNGRYEKASRK